MAQVDLGAYDEAAHACNVTEDCATPKMSSYPTAIVLTVATTTFADRENQSFSSGANVDASDIMMNNNGKRPEIAELMSNVQFTNAQMNEVLAWQDSNGASYEEAAVYFLTNYKDVWGGWLNDAARGKLAALLQ